MSRLSCEICCCGFECSFVSRYAARHATAIDALQPFPHCSFSRSCLPRTHRPCCLGNTSGVKPFTYASVPPLTLRLLQLDPFSDNALLPSHCPWAHLSPTKLSNLGRPALPSRIERERQSARRRIMSWQSSDSVNNPQTSARCTRDPSA